MKKSILALVAAVAFGSVNTAQALNGSLGLEWRGVVPAQTTVNDGYYIQSMGIVDIADQGELKFVHEENGVELETSTTFTFEVHQESKYESPKPVSFKLSRSQIEMNVLTDGTYAGLKNAENYFDLMHNNSTISSNTKTTVDKTANISVKGKPGLSILNAGDDVTLHAYLAISPES